ncbi:MAG: hypothetical protein IJP18_01140 [Oscillospiraceae bacterium]|nr:hypothetical protein [Oscillospiraceae bacterium]
MKLKKLFTAVMSLALMGNVMSYGSVNAQADTPVDIEKSVYDWLVEYGSYDTDKNGDGVISLEEYETMEHMYIDLNYATDLSFLEKAKSLRKVDFSNGTITDFSVLKTMKNLRIIEFVNVPVSDISWSSELDLYMMYLDGTKVTDEHKLSVVQFEDYELPAGHRITFGTKPKGLLDCTFLVENNDIAGFEDEGKDTTEESFYNYLYGKSVGETTYSVLVDGEVVGQGKIKVVPSHIISYAPDENACKVKKSESVHNYGNGTMQENILFEDGRYYEYTSEGLAFRGEGVKDFYFVYSDDNYIEYTIYENGRLDVDKKTVFEEGVTSTEDNFVLKEDGSLFYVYTDGGSKKISDNISELLSSKYAVTQNGHLIAFSQKDDVKDYGSFDIKKFFYSYVSYVLDENGELFAIRSGDKSAKLLCENVTDMGYIKGTDTLVCVLEDGTLKKINNGNIYDYKRDGEYALEDEPYYISYSNPSIMYIPEKSIEVAGITPYIDDIPYMSSIRSDDGVEYFTCLGRYVAMLNVKETFGAFCDGEDYIILIHCNDDTFWEYRIGADTVKKIEFGNDNVTEPGTDDKADAVTLVRLLKYLVNEDGADKDDEGFDVNEDGAVNVVDFIMMKNMLVSE